GLGGSGTVTMNAGMAWTGGTMGGSGVTVVGSESTGTVTGSVILTQSRELRAAGSLSVDATDIQNNQGGAASLSTVAGGTLTLGNSTTNRNWNGCCQVLTINNAGTATKTGSNTLSGNFGLVNTGAMQVNGGTLTVGNGISTPSTASGASYTVN